MWLSVWKRSIELCSQCVCVRLPPELTVGHAEGRWVGFTQPQVRPVRWQPKTNQLSVRCAVPSRTGSLQFLLLTTAHAVSTELSLILFLLVLLSGSSWGDGPWSNAHGGGASLRIQTFLSCVFPPSTCSFCSPNYKMWPNVFILCYYHFLLFS